MLKTFQVVIKPCIYHVMALSILLLATITGNSIAAEQQTSQLEREVEALKKDAMDLNRELFILEEDLLFPANTQFSVFVSIDKGEFIELDSVQLKIDDKNVANYLYTDREVAALKRGGVQRLYIGNLASGEHELVAIITGKGPNQRDHRRGTSLKFTKESEPQFIEIKILDNQSKQQVEFQTKVWN